MSNTKSVTKIADRLAKLDRLASCPGATRDERAVARLRAAELRATARAASTLAAGIRVTGMWGPGTVQYVTPDGWAGVQLDGERRTDEYPVEHLSAA